jgi:hypothetical protein
MKNFKELSNAEKIAEITSCNFWRRELPLAEQYLLALTNDDKEAIAEFETFGDSLCHIIRNRAEYERGLAVFGFTAININEHGWLQRPVFMDCEEIDFPLKAHVIGRNSIIIGRSRNNKWTYGLYLAASKSGCASGLSIYGDPYNARTVCLKAALEDFIAWHIKENDKKTEPVIKKAKDMLDVLTGRKPVQLSLF